MAWCEVFVFVGICCILNANTSHAYSHWVVTEDGLIKAQAESDFDLQRPYDLMGFIRQEQRVELVESLRLDLVNQKNMIDATEDKETDLEAKFYARDLDCLLAGKPLTEFDLYMSTVLPLEKKGYQMRDWLKTMPEMPGELEPDCTAIIDLPFSMKAFEHLPVMQERRKLRAMPEKGLESAILEGVDVDTWGRHLYPSMRNNRKSWLFFNMASFYWRMKGEAYQAIECIRRALHFAPREHTDFALVNLANVLHRAQHSQEALVVLKVSLDVAPELMVNHFTLGNVYAVLGDYNSSVLHFEHTVNIQPDFEEAEEAWKRSHAVLCHSKLEMALEEQHKSLQRTLEELKEYQTKHEKWMKQQQRLLLVREKPDAISRKKVFYEKFKAKEHWSQQSGDEQTGCRKQIKENGHVLISCTLDTKSLHAVRKTRATATTEKEPPPGKQRGNHSKPTADPLYTEENTQPSPFDDPDWPSQEDCATHVRNFPQAKEFPAEFLPAENKGFDVRALLGEAQGLAAGAQHALPWFPPHCDIMKGESADHLPDFGSLLEMSKVAPEQRLKRFLLGYVNDGNANLEEVGQRILSALKQELGAPWLLYNLAGLYWHAAGDGRQSAACYQRSVRLVPNHYADVPYTNMAALTLRAVARPPSPNMAAKLLSVSLAVNPYEPVTNYLFGNMLALQGNMSGAASYHQVALRQDPDLAAAQQTLRAIRCYERFHMRQRDEAEGFSMADDVPEEEEAGTFSSIINGFVCVSLGGVEHCALRQSLQEECCSLLGSPAGDLLEFDALRISDGCSSMESSVLPRQQLCRALYKQDLSVCAVTPAKRVDTTTTAATPTTSVGHDDRLGHADEYEASDVSLAVDISAAESLDDDDDDDDDKRVDASVQEEDVEGEEEVEEEEEGEEGVPRAYTSESPVNEEMLTEPIQPAPVGILQRAAVESDGLLHLEPPKEPSSRDYAPARMPGVRDDDLPEHLFEPDISAEVAMWTTRPSDCSKLKQVNIKKFASTWLSVSTKNINIHDHVDFAEDIGDVTPQQPLCRMTVPHSALMFDHLSGISGRAQLAYSHELGLKEVLQMLGGRQESMGTVATHIALALQKNETSWVLQTLAALYWRVQGRATEAIDCLRQALHHAPRHTKDIALVSLANVLHRSRLYNDAIIVNNMALDIAPNLVVIHFTMANVLAAKVGLRASWGEGVAAKVALRASWGEGVAAKVGLRASW
ncbi:PREDICTED: tetratricopeptide repeat protein 17-like [Priapulus caudatus]|uniref:Tetratricopeptide repeat protein 17-like n=1 Tax=Priapulus caudatus TaxID=37621 RepID=A0ABM1DY59_PRICU|nr:PREDICTED: tetratricopeptide repeat protein 17-like [Priapulus caudatus]